IKAQLVTELDAFRVTTMFTANTELDIRTGLTPLIARDLHQLAHTASVNRGTRSVFHDLELLIVRKETTGIIPAHTQRGLGKIVRAKAKEFCILGDFIGHNRSSGNL